MPFGIVAFDKCIMIILEHSREGSFNRERERERTRASESEKSESERSESERSESDKSERKSESENESEKSESEKSESESKHCTMKWHRQCPHGSHSCPCMAHRVDKGRNTSENSF